MIFRAPTFKFMFETIIAYAITLAVAALVVREEVKEEIKKEKKEQEEIKHLKFFLEKCAEAKKLEENKRRL